MNSTQWMAIKVESCHAPCVLVAIILAIDTVLVSAALAPVLNWLPRPHWMTDKAVRIWAAALIAIAVILSVSTVVLSQHTSEASKRDNVEGLHISVPTGWRRVAGQAFNFA